MHKIKVANPHDRSWTNGSFLFSLGAYGWALVLVYADHLGDALDALVDDYIEDHAPGYLVSPEEQETLIREALADSNHTWEEFIEAVGSETWAQEIEQSALSDTTMAGSHGQRITWEWSIVAENPTKHDLIAIAKRS